MKTVRLPSQEFLGRRRSDRFGGGPVYPVAAWGGRLAELRLFSSEPTRLDEEFR